MCRYRTGEKLQTTCRSSSAAEGTDRCLLCMCNLDTVVGESGPTERSMGFSDRWDGGNCQFMHSLLRDQMSFLVCLVGAVPLTLVACVSFFSVKPEPTAAVGQCCSSEGPCGGPEGAVGCYSSPK
ncbi:hypothetical protein XENOCAPTIV_026458 [Xenoophorus captivus]|uniref:Uncharacterized protein n=1 Tax=Xenoophorus captivus TaxID=1517983 RepID=A0ABV0RSD3_9TELE